jgi:hypothetical protein
MSLSACPVLPRLPTVFSIYQPIEHYWNLCGPVQAFGHEVDPVFNRLDAYLLHLLLDMLPYESVLLDLAMSATGAASSVLGLLHPRVQTVIAGQGPESIATEQAFDALTEYRRRERPAANLVIQPTSEFLAGTVLPPRTVLLADAHLLPPDDLAEVVSRWFDARTDLIIVLLGLGTVGACQVLDAVLRVCPAQGARRFWLARELEGSLSPSSLGVIAHADHAAAANAVLRIQQLHTSNRHLLTLLRASNQTLLESAQLDADVMKTHPSAWALQAEVREAQQRTEEVRCQLRASQQATEAVLQAAHQANEATLQAARAAEAAFQAEIARTRSEVRQVEEYLNTVHSSLAFRVACRLSRWRARLAPTASRRFRLYQHSVGMLRRLARKCWRRSA